MNKNYCFSCGKAYGSSSPCRYCKSQRESDIEKYMERTGQSEASLDLKYHYRYYGNKETYMTSIHPCHTCKYFMYHQYNYCYKCGGSIEQVKISIADLITKYQGYKVGY